MHEEIARVQRSTTKLEILKTLKDLDAETTPSKIAKKLKIHLSSCSRSLKELRKDGLVECLNPKQINFRYFRITPKGIKAIKMIKGFDDCWEKIQKTL